MTSRGTVVVTGASGYIAKHIVHQLLDAGYSVRGTVRTAARGQEITDAVRPILVEADNLDERLRFVELDLTRDEGWGEAMAGADFLLHTASPFPMVQPKDEAAVIRPAVDGTLRALKAARDAGIKRVVMTSSVVAVVNRKLEPGREVYDERDWTDIDDPRAAPYAKSKTLAEKAAWEFVEAQAPDIQFTVINPGFVVGPPLDNNFGTSIEVIQRALRAKDPMLPNVGFQTVDVRDIALMHVRALETPEAIGKRIIGFDRFLWFVDITRTLKQAYPNRRFATRTAPYLLIRVLALFDPAVRAILPNLGRRAVVSNERARSVLGIEFRDARDGIKDAADYLLKHSLV